MGFSMFNEKVVRERALPGDFPPWSTVYGYLRLWQQWGIWKQVHDALRTKLREKMSKKPQASAAILDSQSVKTTEKRGRSTALMSPTKTKGRKRFALVDTLGLVLSLLVLEASCPERLGGAAVLMEAAPVSQNQSGATLGRPRFQWREFCPSG